MNKIFLYVIILIIFFTASWFLFGLSPVDAPTDQNRPVPIGERGNAQVESVDVVVLESFPVQIRVVVKGYLADACTTIGAIETTRRDSVFYINLFTNRDSDALCAQVITPFEESIPLNVLNLPAGSYAVDANGVTADFTLSVDNRPPAN